MAEGRSIFRRLPPPFYAAAMILLAVTETVPIISFPRLKPSIPPPYEVFLGLRFPRSSRLGPWARSPQPLKHGRNFSKLRGPEKMPRNKIPGKAERRWDGPERGSCGEFIP